MFINPLSINRIDINRIDSLKIFSKAFGAPTENLLEISFTITSFSSEGGEKVEARIAERKVVTAATRSRYQRASKKEKGKILAEFIELTGYHRVYARSVFTDSRAKGCPGKANTRRVKVSQGEKPQGL